MVGFKRDINKKTSMGKLRLLFPIFLIILAAIAALYFIIPWLSSQPVRQIETSTNIIIPEGEKIKRHLFFCLDDKLAREERKMPMPILTDDLMTQADYVLKELIKGPVTDLRLTPVLPKETKIRGLFMDSNGICYVDLSKDVQERFPGGVWTELLALYSIVNTLSINFPEIKGVQILVEGNMVETLSGHIDIRYPLQIRGDLLGG